MNRDEFDHVGEILMRPPHVAETAGDLRLNQLREREHRQVVNFRNVLRIARTGKSGRLPRSFTFAGDDKLDGNSG